MKNLLLAIMLFITVQCFAQYPQKIDTAKTMLWLITDKQLRNAIAQSDSLVITKLEINSFKSEIYLKDSIIIQFKKVNSLSLIRVNDLENKFDNCEIDLKKMYVLEKNFYEKYMRNKKLTIFYITGSLIAGFLAGFMIK